MIKKHEARVCFNTKVYLFTVLFLILKVYDVYSTGLSNTNNLSALNIKGKSIILQKRDNESIQKIKLFDKKTRIINLYKEVLKIDSKILRVSFKKLNQEFLNEKLDKGKLKEKIKTNIKKINDKASDLLKKINILEDAKETSTDNTFKEEIKPELDEAIREYNSIKNLIKARSELNDKMADLIFSNNNVEKEQFKKSYRFDPYKKYLEDLKSEVEKAFEKKQDLKNSKIKKIEELEEVRFEKEIKKEVKSINTFVLLTHNYEPPFSESLTGAMSLYINDRELTSEENDELEKLAEKRDQENITSIETKRLQNLEKRNELTESQRESIKLWKYLNKIDFMVQNESYVKRMQKKLSEENNLSKYEKNILESSISRLQKENSEMKEEEQEQKERFIRFINRKEFKHPLGEDFVVNAFFGSKLFKKGYFKGVSNNDMKTTLNKHVKGLKNKTTAQGNVYSSNEENLNQKFKKVIFIPNITSFEEDSHNEDLTKRINDQIKSLEEKELKGNNYQISIYFTIPGHVTIMNIIKNGDDYTLEYYDSQLYTDMQSTEKIEGVKQFLKERNNNKEPKVIMTPKIVNQIIHPFCSYHTLLRAERSFKRTDDKLEKISQDAPPDIESISMQIKDVYSTALEHIRDQNMYDGITKNYISKINGFIKNNIKSQNITNDLLEPLEEEIKISNPKFFKFFGEKVLELKKNIDDNPDLRDDEKISRNMSNLFDAVIGKRPNLGSDFLEKDKTFAQKIQTLDDLLKKYEEDEHIANSRPAKSPLLKKNKITSINDNTSDVKMSDLFDDSVSDVEEADLFDDSESDEIDLSNKPAGAVRMPLMLIDLEIVPNN